MVWKRLAMMVLLALQLKMGYAGSPAENRLLLAFARRAIQVELEALAAIEPAELVSARGKLREALRVVERARVDRERENQFWERVLLWEEEVERQEKLCRQQEPVWSVFNLRRWIRYYAEIEEWLRERTATSLEAWRKFTRLPGNEKRLFLLRQKIAASKKWEAQDPLTGWSDEGNPIETRLFLEDELIFKALKDCWAAFICA